LSPGRDGDRATKGSKAPGKGQRENAGSGEEKQAASADGGASIYSLKFASPPKIEVEQQWPDEGEPGADQPLNTWFETDNKNKIIAKSQHNVRAAMIRLGVAVRYNAFHDQMLIDGLDGHSVLDDPAMEKLWLLADERYRFLAPKDFFWIVVQEAARRNTFHPVRDYLASLTWDGVPRIDRWLVDYGGADATEYICTVGAITLVAAVRRVRKPGCKFDEMLILESPQGTDKSKML
jgi:hypothetical protein